MIEEKIGKNEGVFITNPLDTWSSGARGSSARVFFCVLKQEQNRFEPAAIKIIRPEHQDYALPLFVKEIKILKALKDIPGVTKMIEMGFINPESGYQFPSDQLADGCNNLTGKIIRYSASESIDYEQMVDWSALGWLPYIAMPVRNYRNNLFMLCDPAHTPDHKLFALEKAIDVSIQICGIFSEAHNRNISYLDHKIFHFYWYELLSRAYVIDWNIGRIDKALSDTEKTYDIVQFGARALHFIFTGQFASVPSFKLTRPEDIEIVPLAYRANWGFDNKHIPDSIKQIISLVLNGNYNNFALLQRDLESCKGIK
jgi:serine/threonine protein kinase